MTGARRLTVLAIVAALAATGGACGGGSSGPLPRIVEAEAERGMVEGQALPSMIVTVRFDQPLKFPRSNVPLESNFEFAVPRIEGGGRDRVFVDTAELPKEGGDQIRLLVNRLLPDGTTLIVSDRAFQTDARSEQSITLETGLHAGSVYLATAVMVPSNPAIVSRTQPRAVTAEDRDWAVQRRLLEAHLELRQEDAETRSLVLERYDAMPVEVVTHPKIAAALAALTGTFAEPAIDSFLTNNNCTGRPAARLAFESPPNFPNLIARVTHRRDGSRVVSFNPVTEADRFETLMAVVAHEAVHCDDEDSLSEEVAATALDTFLYLQLIAVDPTLVLPATTLVRDLNINGILMINSGRAVPESVGLLQSAGVREALPGFDAPSTGTIISSFADLVAASYASLPLQSGPEQVSQAYIARLIEVAGGQTRSAFEIPYLDFLLGNAMPMRVMLSAIDALQLAPLDE